ncbi:ATP-dependent dna helicase [Fusarium flagelliforme]|uniref:ATP-dependent dna helicase n=1 Tax=Fusarium flagelliforme TaxID=2675880 RepID=A0A395MZQ2_9HYPO|nr:ATP-dependent dna helicase [Fusarium flagelliforme]
MDNLPSEIIRKIILSLIVKSRWFPQINEHCPVTPLARYAVISRQWQSIVESITFRHLILNSTRLDVAQRENYLSPLRLSYIRYIWYDFEFPAHNLIISTNPEEDYDDQLVFNKSAKQLFSVLSQIPPRPEPVVGLEIFITPPKKFALRLLRNETKRSVERFQVLCGTVTPMFVELFKDWEADIGDIPAIHYFRVEPGSASILFSPSSINRFASKMTRLSKLEWWLTDEEFIEPYDEMSQRTKHLPSGECIAQFTLGGSGVYIYDQNILNRFAIAAGICAARMPKIEELNIINHGRSQIGICFNTKSEDVPCLEFAGKPAMPELSEETVEVWKRAIKTHGLDWNVHITDNLDKVYHFY